MFIEADPDWGGHASRCASRIRCALSLRTQPPRYRQCADLAPCILCASRLPSDPSISRWRVAQLLRMCAGVSVARVSGHYGICDRFFERGELTTTADGLTARWVQVLRTLRGNLSASQSPQPGIE